MILSEISTFATITQTNSQRIIVKCDNCEKEWNSTLINQKSGFKKYDRDLCRGCKQHQHVLSGVRSKQYVNAGLASSKNKGKTLEEILGKEKAKISKDKNSATNSGKNNANFGGKYSHGWGNESCKDKFKGKTIEEIWGEEKGKQLRQHYSESRKGENNNMYGKPSPQGSGNGWSGWYEGWFFRSLKELSYMIFVIERFNMKWENGEKSKFKIFYEDHLGIKKTYHPDFFINDKFLVEIKPKHLWNSDGVKRKTSAAIKFCNENNFNYKLTECTKQITFKEIKHLIENNKLQFTQRYNEKFKEYEINYC